MTVQFRKSFVKDLQALEPDYRPRVEKAIREIERAASLRELSQLKKLQGRSGFSGFAWVIIGWAWPSFLVRRL